MRNPAAMFRVAFCESRIRNNLLSLRTSNFVSVSLSHYFHEALAVCLNFHPDEIFADYLPNKLLHTCCSFWMFRYRFPLVSFTPVISVDKNQYSRIKKKPTRLQENSISNQEISNIYGILSRSEKRCASRYSANVQSKSLFIIEISVGLMIHRLMTSQDRVHA